MKPARNNQSYHVKPSRILILAAIAALVAGAPAGAKVTKKPQCVVPNLKGDTLATARKRITAAHCTLGTVTEPEAKSGQTLIVSATSPRAGKREKNKARVSVMLKVKQSAAATPTVTTPTVTTPAVTTPATTTPAAPALTATYLIASSLALDGETESDVPTAYFMVYARLTYDTASDSLMYLVGQPVSYTITDQVTGATIASFQGSTVTGVGSEGCAIGYSISGDETTLTLTGEPINPETGAAPLPACFSGVLTVPYSDPLNLNASFAGNSTYDASTAQQPGL